MIVKFHARGSGGGSGPVDYLLGKDRDREGSKLDRGHPEAVQEIIDTSPYAKKYTSGVLSFKEADLPQADKDKIMSSFEDALLPGLDKDQYTCLWVEHTDKGRLELNFVVPNIELQTGKRLQPYYERADKTRINAWKVCTNGRYKLHDPDDPKHKRELVTPKDLPQKKQEASQAITNGLLNLAESGQIKNRSDVISTLEGAGFTVARTTKKSISVADPDGGQNIRLKGALYEQDFKFGAELRGTIEAASRQYRADSETRLREAREVYLRGVEIKREENQRRHPRPAVENEPSRSQNVGMAPDHTGGSPVIELGRGLDTGGNDRQELEDHQPARGQDRRVGRNGEQDSIEPLRGQPPVVRLDRQEGRNLQRGKRRVQSAKRVLSDDGIRDAIIDRINAIRERVQNAKQSLREGANSITRDVRDYLTGKQAFTGTSYAVELPSKRLDRAVAEVKPTIDNMSQPQRYREISR